MGQLMADVAHTVPASVVYLEGSNFGLSRPGIQVTAFASGKMLTRDWSGHNLRQYDLAPAMFASTDDTLEEWETFWKQIDGGASAGYIVEPVSGTHRDLICGALADGTQTTFPLPALAPTSTVIYKDGVFTSGYTIHLAANLLTDAQAECGDANDFTAADASISARAVSCDGLGAIRVLPDGGAKPSVYSETRTSGISTGEDYSCVGAVLASTTHNYNAAIYWYESDDSFISVSDGSDVSVSANGEWSVMSVTATAPALAAKARGSLRRNNTVGTDVFYMDCLALIPGDYTRWHLPSVAPGLIEFVAAPASGSRITATATGKRITRCRFEPGTRWSLSSAGHASARSIVATEWPEF